MLNQSMKFNILACLLLIDALSSDSFACFRCYFFQNKKEFRYAARVAFSLTTTTEQLHTHVISATYSHLATFAPYG